MSRRGGVAGHVFISYVREDSHQVDQLQRTLQAAGIPVWRDTADLWPGEDWRAKIRRAITDNALVFIACFSQASLSRGKSYHNEELTLAIEQLRLRRPDDPWLIPVRLDGCDIPDRDIGGGRTLTSIQHADLFGDGSDDGAARLVAAILRILGRHSDGEAADGGREPDARAGRVRQAAVEEKRRAEEFGRRSENDRLESLATAISPLLGSLGFEAPSESLDRIYERYYFHSGDSYDSGQRRRFRDESLSLVQDVRVFPSLTQRVLQSIGESVLEGRFDAQPPVGAGVVRRVDQFVVLVSLRSVPLTRLTRALLQFEVVDAKVKYLHYQDVISVPFEHVRGYMHVVADKRWRRHWRHQLQGFTREHLTKTHADLEETRLTDENRNRLRSIDTRPIDPINLEIENGRLWVDYRTRDIGTPAGDVPWHIHVLAVDNVRHEMDAAERLEAGFTRAAQR